MMCQEVIELMQRYLDRDLDETEYRRMLVHLEACPDCTELFERLVNVSQELESLPKVLPPFSLVDAILPKLEELEAQGMDTAEKGLAAGMEKAPSEPPAAAEPRLAPRPERGSWRKNVREWVSFPVFGGVVAAGLVLGFFLFGQGQPGQDADQLLSGFTGSSAQESASPAPAAAGAAEQNAAGGGAGQNGGGEPPKADALNPPAVTDEVKPADGANTNAGSAAPKGEQPAPPAGSTTKQPAGSEAKDASAPKQEQPSQRAASQNQPALPPKSEETGTGQQAEVVPPAGAAKEPASSEPAAPEGAAAGSGGQESAGEPSGEAADTFRAAEGGSEGSAQSLTAPDAKSPPEAPGGTGESTSLMGASSIRSAVPVHELAAEGGAYTAVVADGKVQIKDKDGKVVFTSMDWSDADRIDLKKWSDGKLTYHVEMETGGQIRCFIVDAKAGTETEAKKTP
ncbi:hypothetical protein J2T17_002959 [Paenibacillus mucilaginosus]